MMSGDVFVADAFSQMSRDTLGQSSRVNENERCMVLASQLREAVANFVPNLTRHHGLQGRLWNFDRDIELRECPVSTILQSVGRHFYV